MNLLSTSVNGPRLFGLTETDRRPLGVHVGVDHPALAAVLDPRGADLQLMLEWRQQANGDPAAEAKAWGAKLVEAERKREKYQEMFAEEAMTLEELKAKLEVLEETRDKAKRELSSLADKREELEAIERDMDQILESYAALAPEALGMLFPQRNAGRYTLYLISPSRLWPTEH